MRDNLEWINVCISCDPMFDYFDALVLYKVRVDDGIFEGHVCLAKAVALFLSFLDDPDDFVILVWVRNFCNLYMVYS